MGYFKNRNLTPGPEKMGDKRYKINVDNHPTVGHSRNSNIRDTRAPPSGMNKLDNTVFEDENHRSTEQTTTQSQNMGALPPKAIKVKITKATAQNH